MSRFRAGRDGDPGESAFCRPDRRSLLEGADRTRRGGGPRRARRLRDPRIAAGRRGGRRAEDRL